ncbi:superoxide dismutase [Syncephalis fuscata]|nr:superoxide dismutase [Syncephalis fuscata]
MMGLKNVFHACMLALAFTSLTVTALPAETAKKPDNVNSVKHSFVAAKKNGFEAFFFITPMAPGAGISIVGTIGGKIPVVGEYAYHVHEKPVPADGNCTATGGHFDPYGKKGAKCTKQTLNDCELGDLSGKFGKVKFGSTQKNDYKWVTYVDPTITLDKGENGILGRSIVVHNPSGDRIACANIEKK